MLAEPRFRIHQLLVYGTTLASALVSSESVVEGYEVLWILPIAFFVAYMTYLRRTIEVRPYLFRIVFVATAYLRYVVAPSLIVLTGQYGTVSKYVPRSVETQLAIILMVTELFACTFVLFLADSHRRRILIVSGAHPKYLSRAVNLPKHTSIRKHSSRQISPERYNYPLVSDHSIRYLAFIVPVPAILLLSPVASGHFTFVFPRDDALGLDLSEVQLSTQIAVMLLILAKHLFFLLVMDWAIRRHRRLGRVTYVFIAGSAVIMNSLLYYGTNRLTAVAVAVASFMVFYSAFPRYRRLALAAGIAVSIVIFQGMTEARGIHDYFSQYTGGERVLRNAEHQINQYLGGVHNVAIGVQTADAYSIHRDVEHLAYDMVRPIIGLNWVVRSLDIESSNVLFNSVYFQSEQVNVIMPGIAQGFFYFGPYGAWLIPAFLLIVGLMLESIYLRIPSLSFLYVVSIGLVRFGMSFGSNTNIQLNELSLQLALPLIVLLTIDRTRAPS